MKIVTALCALLLLALCCVPVVSAGGMVKFHVSPIPDPKVGDTVTATIYNDNNLAPKEGDVVLMLDWNPEIMRYVSSTVEQGHTTASDPIGAHNLEIRSADSVNGLPNGDGALATVTFKIVGPGFTPIVVDVRSVTDVAGTEITSRAVARNGAVTATGTAASGVTTAPTTVATATVPVPVVTIPPPPPVTVIATPVAVVTVAPVPTDAGTPVVDPVSQPVAVVTTDPTAEVTPASISQPASPTSRFGSRRYVVGTVPKNLPRGISVGTGTGSTGTRGRTALGAGVATGVKPPMGRFVRWSPAARWRAGLR